MVQILVTKSPFGQRLVVKMVEYDHHRTRPEAKGLTNPTLNTSVSNGCHPPMPMFRCAVMNPLIFSCHAHLCFRALFAVVREMLLSANPASSRNFCLAHEFLQEFLSPLLFFAGLMLSFLHSFVLLHVRVWGTRRFYATKSVQC